MKKRIFIILCVLGILLTTRDVSALGMSVSPSRLYFEDSSPQSLTVTNSSKDVAVYVAYPDEFESSIIIEPKEFALDPKRNRKITVQVKTSPDKSIATNISLIARPATNSDMAFQTGIKIPLKATFASNAINLTASVHNAIANSKWYIIALFIILVVFIARKYIITKLP